MRFFLATVTFLLIITAASVKVGAEPGEAYGGETKLLPGIYCYDYYFLGNKAFDTSLFSGINPNATFLDQEDLLYFEGHEPCSTSVVSGKADLNQFDSLFVGNKMVDYSTDSTKILPNPGVMFVDEENIDFQKFSSGDTILYGGVLPFVALPDTDLETEDSFFNEESFSLFLYFKTKF